MMTAYDIPSGRGLDCVGTKDLDLQVDTSKASATGIFAAASKDRGGDLLLIEGIQVANHKKNPIVLFCHGMAWHDPDGDKPIGTTESPDGEYMVKLLPAEGIAVATTFFSQKTLLASQICALVMERTLRAQSIGYRDIATERMYEGDNYIGTKLVEIEMLETSWVCLPMNQDAVRSTLSRDLCCGKSLSPAIRAALTPYASPKPAWAHGFTLPTPEAKTMTATPAPVPAPGAVTATIDEAALTAKITANVTADLEKKAAENALAAKALADKTAAETAGVKKPAAKTKADDAAGEEDEATADPHGAKALRAGHKALCRAKAVFAKGCDGFGPNETIKGILDAHCEALDDHIERVKGDFDDQYGAMALDPLEDKSKDDEDDTGEAPPADDSSKADDDAAENSEEGKALMAKLRQSERELTHKLRLLNQA
jgi:hypothetical protein